MRNLYGYLLLVGLIALSILLWVLRSHFESEAYNKLTGSHTTTWDAMFLELRVQDQPNRK